MDWVTAAGLVMSALATADLAYKYVSAILKKITAGHVSQQRKKYTATTTSREIIEKRSRPTLENANFRRGSYARSVSVWPAYGLDIAVYHPQLKKI
jgi:hypothetical protein